MLYHGIISCVSDEFEKVGAPFPGLRGQLRGYLARTRCNVRVQEDFPQTAVDTVKKLVAGAIQSELTRGRRGAGEQGQSETTGSTRYTWDVMDWVDTVTDPPNNVTDDVFDKLSRIVKRTEPTLTTSGMPVTKERLVGLVSGGNPVQRDFQ